MICYVGMSDMKSGRTAFVGREIFNMRSITLIKREMCRVVFIIPWLIIALGTFLRVAQALPNRSLWFDEARLALNIVNRTFSQLLLPLDYDQAAPIGFLIVEKIAIQMFGNREFALRLFPMFCGILSLYLYCEVAKRYVTPIGVNIGLALMSLSAPLIYYSSEVKQYSSDVAIALLLTLLGLRYLKFKQPTIFDTVILATIGGIAVWFSQPSVFVLAALGMSLVLAGFGEKSGRPLVFNFFIYTVWGASFAFYYFYSLRYLIGNEELVKYWNGAFMPFPPFSLSGLKWLFDTAFGMFADPVGLSAGGLALVFFIVGCRSVWLRQKESVYLLLSPMLFALLASALGKYPFRGRLLLFIVPSTIILISAGIEDFRQRIASRAYGIGLIVVGIFLVPTVSAAYHVSKPRMGEELKPVLNYVMTRRHGGDIEYVYFGAKPSFEYYKSRYHLTDGNIEGARARGNWNDYARDVDKLKGKPRVWIIFSHFDAAEEEFFLYYLGTIGKKRDAFESQGAAAYLYDLSESSRSEPGFDNQENGDRG